MMTPHLLGIFTDIYGASADAMTISRSLLISLVGFLTVLVVLGVIALFIKLIAFIFDTAAKKSADKTAAQTAAPAANTPAGTPLPESQSQGTLELIDTDEPTAAVIMALVSHQSGIPLNRLAFKSIRLMEDDKK